MNNLMLIVLSLSLSGSVFIAILLLCKPLYRERLSKRWQYYVWLIVIARLLVPFSFEVNIIGNLFNEVSIHDEANVVANTETNVFEGAGDEVQISPPYISYRPPNIHNVAPPIPANTSESQTPVPAPYPQSSTFDALTSYIWLLWIGVAIILFIRKLTIYQSFANYIKAGRVELNSIEDLERFGKILEQSNIKRMVGIYTHSLVSSPLLIGFFKPYIVLPTTNISESDFKHTVLHELIHYKRGDMFYKWLVQLTICLHWFNPLVYLMAREINNACEFSCDEAVIKNLDNGGKKAYGNTLLNALGFGGDYKSSLSSVTLGSNKKIIGERLNMIKNFKKKSKFVVICAILLTMLLGISACAVGAYGAINPLSGRRFGNSLEGTGDVISGVGIRDRITDLPRLPIPSPSSNSAGRGHRASVRSSANFPPSNREREYISNKFPNLPFNFNSPAVYVGVWSLFDTNDYSDLEISVTNGNVQFVIYDGDFSMDVSVLRSAIERVPAYRRMFLVAENSLEFGYVHPSHVHTLYVFDDTRIADENSVLTIIVPRSNVQLFNSVVIHAENGSIDMSNEVAAILSDNITINGIEAIRLRNNEIFMDNTDTATPPPQPNTDNNVSLPPQPGINISQSEARIIAGIIAAEANLNWHGNIEKTGSVDDRTVYAFLYLEHISGIDYSIGIGHLIVIDSNGGELLAFEMLAFEHPYDMFGNIELAWAYFIQNNSLVDNDVDANITLPPQQTTGNLINEISGDFELHIPFIAAGESILVGRLNLPQGQMFGVSIDAATGGIGTFTGVRSDASMPDFNDPWRFNGPWRGFSMRTREESNSTTFVFEDNDFVYLHAGSTGSMDLTDVTIRITMLN